MFFAEYFSSNPRFQFEQGLYYQNDLSQVNPFEQSYIALREKESRVYADDVAKKLPVIDSHHPTSKEWKVREHSANKLSEYLRDRKNLQTLIEVGCGNGWLTNFLGKNTGKEWLGIDINLTELKQAARLFQSEKINFAYADIQSDALKGLRVDAILLPSCLQYFEDARALIRQLFKMLQDQGEVHILDTPIYRPEEIQQARERSMAYFSGQGSNVMKTRYHHHDWRIFDGMKYTVLHNPHSLGKRALSKVVTQSPFPWVRVTNS